MRYNSGYELVPLVSKYLLSVIYSIPKQGVTKLIVEMPRVVFRYDYYINGGIGICQLRCYLFQIRQFELDGLAIETDLKKRELK